MLANTVRRSTAPVTLDRIDRQIVGALQNNARMSNKELAATVRLAPSSCLQRVRRLRANHVLRGFHAEVDPVVLGIELEALIAVRLQQHSRETVESFRNHVLGLPDVVALYHLAGSVDFLVHVAAPSAQYLRNLALDAFTSRAEVAHLETSLIFDSIRTRRLPDFTEHGSGMVRKRRRRRS